MKMIRRTPVRERPKTFLRVCKWEETIYCFLHTPRHIANSDCMCWNVTVEEVKMFLRVTFWCLHAHSTVLSNRAPLGLCCAGEPSRGLKTRLRGIAWEGKGNRWGGRRIKGIMANRKRKWRLNPPPRNFWQRFQKARTLGRFQSMFGHADGGLW